MVTKKRESSGRRSETEADDSCCSMEWYEERAGTILGGTILIVIGSVFLAQTLGYLPWSIWETVTKLWPLLLMIVGLWLIGKYLVMKRF